jgi:ADP-ribosylation factor GTPase-activating protein 1
LQDIELEKMRVGGNQKMRSFVDEQDSWNDSDPINKRYNSLAAALYRDKISTLAQGQEWNQAEAKKRVEKQSSSNHMSHSKSTGALPDYNNSHSDESGGGGGYQNYNTQEFKDRKQDYFSKIQSENAQRPEHLPPSQGGRYAGFGNTPMQPPPRSQSELFDNTWSSLASGWSVLSSSATKIASTAKDNALKYGSIAGQKVVEVSQNVSEKVEFYFIIFCCYLSCRMI